MIMIWNRKEVFFGHSLQDFNEVRQIIEANHIKYKYRLVNNHNTFLLSSRRARIGSFGEKSEYAITYYIYVHRDDYENALAVVRANTKRM